MNFLKAYDVWFFGELLNDFELLLPLTEFIVANRAAVPRDYSCCFVVCLAGNDKAASLEISIRDPR